MKPLTNSIFFLLGKHLQGLGSGLVHRAASLCQGRKEEEGEKHQRSESRYAGDKKRHMYPSVHCSSIYNSQDMEAT